MTDKYGALVIGSEKNNERNKHKAFFSVDIVKLQEQSCCTRIKHFDS